MTTPIALADLQRQMAAAIMAPLTPKDEMRPQSPNGRPMSELAATFIAPNSRLTPFERLEIYNRQYWYRLIDCFYEDFPGLRTLIGDKPFFAMAVAYLVRHPSRSFTLRDLGQDLGKFLEEDPQWTAKHAPLARDLVRLEWAHIVAFDGEALPLVEIDELLGKDPATLRLALQPYLTLLTCEYPVDTYLLATRRRPEPQGGASHAMAEQRKKKSAKKVPRPREEKVWLAIHRHNNSVYYKRLEPAAHALLTHLCRGETLAQACEAAAAVGDATFGGKLKEWFAQWASFGWFVRRE